MDDFVELQTRVVQDKIAAAINSLKRRDPARLILISDKVELTATTRPMGKKFDKRILYDIQMKGRRFIPAAGK